MGPGKSLFLVIGKSCPSNPCLSFFETIFFGLLHFSVVACGVFVVVGGLFVEVHVMHVLLFGLGLRAPEQQAQYVGLVAPRHVGS